VGRAACGEQSNLERGIGSLSAQLHELWVEAPSLGDEGALLRELRRVEADEGERVRAHRLRGAAPLDV